MELGYLTIIVFDLDQEYIEAWMKGLALHMITASSTQVTIDFCNFCLNPDLISFRCLQRFVDG